jgi:hypothetical protein
LADSKESQAIALGAFSTAVETYISTTNEFLGTLIDDFSGYAAVLLGL